MEKSLDWFSSLDANRRQELALDYYGTDFITNAEIELIFLAEYRYYIEFDGKRKFLCLFPAEDKKYNKDFKTLEEAMNYMLVDFKIREVTIRN